MGFIPPTALGDDQQFGAEGLKDPYGKRQLLERIALVHMEAAFHGDDRQAFQFAAHEPTAVPCYGRLEEVRNRFVIQIRLDFNLFHKSAETGAKNDPGARNTIPLRPDRGAGGLNLVNEFEHGFVPVVMQVLGCDRPL